jgi:hypothetical protein
MVKYAHNFRQSSAINPTALWAGTGIDDIWHKGRCRRAVGHLCAVMKSLR